MHDHVNIAVQYSTKQGVEQVPAHHLENGNWLLLRSPLYALEIVAGDIIRVIDDNTGTFKIVAHGGNVAVQFYLGEWDDLQATATAANKITPKVVKCGGSLDGQTAGLLVYTIPLAAGFSTIESIFIEAVDEFPGAQWQFTNVYDFATGEPLCWWE